MASPSAHYPHVPLDRKSASSRLLSLSLDETGTIQGHLKSFEISKCPPFMALSYTWGAPHPTYEISLQGKPYLIRENLRNAIHGILRHRERYERDTKYPEDVLVDENGTIFQYIWIDQICINQDNIAERNHQVNMMKDIYSKASLVVTWLGQGDPSAIDCMRRFREYRSLGGFGQLHAGDLLLTSSILLDLEYFHRMWIVQELALASRFIVIYGDEVLPGSVISLWARYQPSSAAYAGGKVLSSVHLTRDLRMLIYRFGGQKCTDVRDRVYGLLGIAENRAAPLSPEIMANYELSPFELYLKLLKEFWCDGWVLVAWRDVRKALEIPDDFVVPLDDQSQKLQWRWNPSSGYDPFYDGFPHECNFCSLEFLTYVRSLDWTNVELWPRNYDALHIYNESCTVSFSVGLGDLEASPGRLIEWVIATLDEDVEEWSADVLARRMHRSRDARD